MSYGNLYFKSEYSMFNSLCRIDESILKAKEAGFHALAITDDGNMHGTLKFYQGCLKHGIKPIIGLETTYLCHSSAFTGQYAKLLLYATNNYGYRNLLKISSYQKLNGAVNLAFLEKCALGLIVIIPSHHIIFSENCPSNVIRDNYIRELKTIFPMLYLGMCTVDLPKLGILFEQIKKILALEIVALHLVTYLTDEQKPYFEVLRTIGSGSTEPLENDQHLLNSNELEKIFEGHLEYLIKTKEIVDLCQVTITLGQYQLPEYDESIETKKYLEGLCHKGLKKRLKQNRLDNQATVYLKRLREELNIIDKMGFNDYFLIVWDFIKYAKNNDILVGPGRGSAPASLVSYCLGITDIDPVKYQLLFERFLNSERITMPDIDIDFPDHKRDQVIRYVGEKYGKNKVAHIVTYGTFAARSAVRDVAKVFKLDQFKLDEIIKCLPSHSYSSLTSIIKESDRLKQLIVINEDIENVLTTACAIEGLPRNTSTHAAGIVITKYDLVNYTALDKGLSDLYQTQFDATDLEILGLIKMDFLGLKNLTIIEKCVALIKQDYPYFMLPHEYNDKNTFKMLALGDTTGVFQLESPGMRKTLKQIKVSSFNDIAHAIALYRPGPMEIIPTFIKRKLGQELVTYPHPDLEKILKETYGTIVYQEQIMLIAWQFAGFSLGEADVLRRAITKKNKSMLMKEQQNFIDKCCQKGYDVETAEAVFNYIEKFASYGFNKPHSVAYAVIAYQTAFLKKNFTGQYFATLMSLAIGADQTIKSYYQEAVMKNIAFSPPNINESTDKFSYQHNQITFPLTAVNGIGMGKVEQLLLIRSEGLFIDYNNFIKRTKNLLDETQVTNLIFSGALDDFKITKKVMLENYHKIINSLQYYFIETKSIDLLDPSEFPFGLLAEKELQTLGLNLRYDILKNYAQKYPRLPITLIKDVAIGQRVNLLGTVKSCKEIKTKTNELMAFVVMEDQTAKIDIPLFPLFYDKYRLNTGDIIIGRGIITKRRDELQLNVDEIIKCEE